MKKISNIKMKAINRDKKNFLRGYIAGKSDVFYVSGYREGREKGLKDAWECAKRICSVARGFSLEELDRIFGYTSIDTIMDVYSASEAMAKIREFEATGESER